MAHIDKTKLVPLLLNAILGQDSQRRAIEANTAASERDQEEHIQRLLIAAGLRGPKEEKKPDTDLVSEIQAAIKGISKTRREFRAEHEGLVGLAGKKNLDKSQLKELKDLRKQFSAAIQPGIDELRFLEVLSLQTERQPQADLARNAIEQLSRVDPVSPASGLFGKLAARARATAAGRAAPAPDTMGSFAFTGGPGGASGKTQGTPDDILATLQEFLGRGPGAIERTGPRPVGPGTAQARAPVVPPATASKGPAVSRMFPEGQNTLLDPILQRVFESIFTSLSDPEDRAAGLGIEGLAGF